MNFLSNQSILWIALKHFHPLPVEICKRAEHFTIIFLFHHVTQMDRFAHCMPLILSNELNTKEFRESWIFGSINLAAVSAALIYFEMHHCNTARLFKGKEAKAYSFLFFSSSLFSSTKTISSGPRTVSTTQFGFSSTFFHANGELVRAELNLRVIVPFRKDF